MCGGPRTSERGDSDVSAGHHRYSDKVSYNTPKKRKLETAPTLWYSLGAFLKNRCRDPWDKPTLRH